MSLFWTEWLCAHQQVSSHLEPAELNIGDQILCLHYSCFSRLSWPDNISCASGAYLPAYIHLKKLQVLHSKTAF